LDGSAPFFSQSETIAACRSCGSARLEVFLDLGVTPLVDRLVEVEHRDAIEPAFPLKTALCRDCSLVQITETVAPELLFEAAYPYYSSVSPALLAHSRANVLDILTRKTLGPDSLVIELASNDGYLLKNYCEVGIPALGIDPAPGPAVAAQKIGVRTKNAFFTKALAEELVSGGIRADVIHANNVLAHVADTNGFVSGIASVLKDDGLVVIEVPYLRPLIEQVAFDTIYHEHLCYFSVTALDILFRRHGLYLNEIMHLSIHGGSLRLFVEKVERPGPSVHNALDAERRDGLTSIDYFQDFTAQVDQLRHDLVALLRRLKAEGRSIAAYGAAAKGATLINYARIGTDLIDVVFDRNVHKRGKLMPGQKIPIQPAEAMVDAMPDYVLILAWNFADEIMSQQALYAERGGKFIVPVPVPRIL
jgi:SAM-dependent methyltransferase